MPSGTMRILNPLPRRFLTEAEGIGGRIKVRPEDFLVSELPLYEPCGRGEHLYLQVQKTGVAHGELISKIQRHFGVSEGAIGFAGMKDKVAITGQTISVHLLADPPSVDLDDERIQVVEATRHTNKLRRGHLAGNRFSVRMREVDPLKAPVVLRTLRRLEQSGAPCYFGFQRFGYRCNSHVLGAGLLLEDWRGVLEELLGSGGSPFPEHQRERRELFDAGRYEEAATLWSSSDRAERAAIIALWRGRNDRQACRAIHRTARAFWISALQSAVFNRVLDQRIEAGTLMELVEGDVAWKHDSRAMFLVTAEELARPELAGRVEAIELSSSGPMWGWGMKRAAGGVDRIEQDAVVATGIALESFLDAARGPKGGRRPMRTPLFNPQVDSGIDEHGGYIRVAFDLPRGAYATVVLREIMKSAVDAGWHDSAG